MRCQAWCIIILIQEDLCCICVHWYIAFHNFKSPLCSTTCQNPLMCNKKLGKFCQFLGCLLFHRLTFCNKGFHHLIECCFVSWCVLLGLVLCAAKVNQSFVRQEWKRYFRCSKAEKEQKWAVQVLCISCSRNFMCISQIHHRKKLPLVAVDC